MTYQLLLTLQRRDKLCTKYNLVLSEQFVDLQFALEKKLIGLKIVSLNRNSNLSE